MIGRKIFKIRYEYFTLKIWLMLNLLILCRLPLTQTKFTQAMDAQKITNHLLNQNIISFSLEKLRSREHK